MPSVCLSPVLHKYFLAVKAAVPSAWPVTFFLHWFYSALANNYACSGFVVCPAARVHLPPLLVVQSLSYTCPDPVYSSLQNHTSPSLFRMGSRAVCLLSQLVGQCLLLLCLVLVLLSPCVEELTSAFLVQLLSFRDTIAAYRSVYYIGTVVPIIVILLGKAFPPPRTRSKDAAAMKVKEEAAETAPKKEL